MIYLLGTDLVDIVSRKLKTWLKLCGCRDGARAPRNSDVLLLSLM